MPSSDGITWNSKRAEGMRLVKKARTISYEEEQRQIERDMRERLISGYWVIDASMTESAFAEQFPVYLKDYARAYFAGAKRHIVGS